MAERLDSPKGYENGFQELGASERSAGDTGIPEDPLRAEPQPIRYLRKYSNYLTPSLGLLSGDEWAVAATVARNLILNLSLIIPVFLFALLLPRFRDPRNPPTRLLWRVERWERGLEEVRKAHYGT